MSLRTLDAAVAARFAEQALINVVREFPARLDQTMAGPADLRLPRALHPAFYGSYDWHSSVHMHWLLVMLRRRFAALPQTSRIDALLDCHLAPPAIAGELDFLASAHAQSFERTYGWAWLLQLATELERSPDADARRWQDQLRPLTDAFVARYLRWLPQAHYPIRHGTHANSAFGLLFALDHARENELPELAALCVFTAQRWYGDDRDAPASWEPSGADFLSPTLVEAALMRRVLPAERFTGWLDRWLPGLAAGAAGPLGAPVVVADRTDPQLVHLDGLNLSRAWCWRDIAVALPPADPSRTVATDAAAAHIDAGMAGLASDEYVGAHWLATFAALALGGNEP